MAVGYLPLAVLEAVHLRSPQGVAARQAVDGARSVLKAGGVGYVAHHVVRLQFENVRRAIGEGPLEGGEEFVELTLPHGVAQRTKDAYWLVARPECSAWARVAVVQGEFGFVQCGLDPASEVVAVGHTASVLNPHRQGAKHDKGDPASTTITYQAVRVRHHLEKIEDRNELRHMALSTLPGPIRESLLSLVAEIDAVHDMLDHGLIELDASAYKQTPGLAGVES